jgi:hypothetical protein
MPYLRRLMSYIVGLAATAIIFVVLGYVTNILYGVNVLVVGSGAEEPFLKALSLVVTVLGVLLSLCIGVVVHKTTGGVFDHRSAEVFEPVAREQRPSVSYNH